MRQDFESLNMQFFEVNLTNFNEFVTETKEYNNRFGRLHQSSFNVLIKRNNRINKNKIG